MEIKFSLITTVIFLLGYSTAEIVHKISLRKMRKVQKLNALKAEYLDKQYWQFISLDEWIRGSL